MTMQTKSARRRQHPVDLFHRTKIDNDNRSAASGNAVAPISSSAMATPYSGIIQKHINDDDDGYESTNDQPVFGMSSIIGAQNHFVQRGHNNGHNTQTQTAENELGESTLPEDDSSANALKLNRAVTSILQLRKRAQNLRLRIQIPKRVPRLLLILMLTLVSKYSYKSLHKKGFHIMKLPSSSKAKGGDDGDGEGADGEEKDEDAEPPVYPEFVFDHPYVTSSYYISTSNTKILEKMYQLQVEPKKDRLPDRERGIVSRLAM